MRGTCKKCGEPHVTPLGHPACSAHAKRTGSACRANPVRGAAVCSKHGGQIGAVKRKAAERVAAEKVARTLGELMAEHDNPGQHPFDALLEVTRGMSTVTRFVQQRLADLTTAAPDDETQAALVTYERFARSLAQIAKTVLDANLEERLARIEEAKVEQLFAAVVAGLRDVGLPLPEQDAVRGAVAERLRALPRA